MSSILDAIHEIEHRQGTPAVSVPTVLPESRSVRLPALGGALAIVLTALATLSTPLWRSTAPTTPGTATSAVGNAPTLPEVPARPAIRAEEAATEPPRAVRKTAAVRARESGAAAPAAAAPAAPKEKVVARAGGVHLEALSYSPAPSARSATLVVGGVRYVLHEGESRGNVAVQLIMHNRVYVAEGGNVFALEAPR